MKTIISLFVSMLICVCIYSQETKDSIINRGEITLNNDKVIQFADLHFQKHQVIFYNLRKKIRQNLFHQSYKSIKEYAKDKEYNIYVEEFVKPIQTADSLLGTFVKENYPEGIYNDIQSFIDKKPSVKIEIWPIKLHSLSNEKVEDVRLENQLFFFRRGEEDQVKLRNVFAVSYKGQLFFQLSAILSKKYKDKNDTNQSSDNPNSFARVQFAGNNYYYVEAILANPWAKGFAYGAMGGAIGGAITARADYLKSIVYDVKNNQFNIMKNCVDFNNFIKDISPNDVQDCSYKMPDRNTVKATFFKLK